MVWRSLNALLWLFKCSLSAFSVLSECSMNPEVIEKSSWKSDAKRWRLCALDKLGSDGQTKNSISWAPVGAKNVIKPESPPTLFKISRISTSVGFAPARLISASKIRIFNIPILFKLWDRPGDNVRTLCHCHLYQMNQTPPWRIGSDLVPNIPP